MSERTFKERVLMELDDGKEWEHRGLGAHGLVTDYLELSHWDDRVRDEIDEFERQVRDPEFVFETEQEFFDAVNDYALVTPPVWMQEDEVAHAGIDKCARFLRDRGIADGFTGVEDLWFALYWDLHDALVKAFCEIVKLVETEDKWKEG